MEADTQALCCKSTGVVVMLTLGCMEATNDEMGLADMFIRGVAGVGANVHSCGWFEEGPAMAVFGGTIQNAPIAADGMAHMGTSPPPPPPPPLT